MAKKTEKRATKGLGGLKMPAKNYFNSPGNLIIAVIIITFSFVIIMDYLS